MEWIYRNIYDPLLFHEFFGLCSIQVEDLYSTIFHTIIFPYMIIQGLLYEEIAFIFEFANTLLLIHIYLS